MKMRKIKSKDYVEFRQMKLELEAIDDKMKAELECTK